MLSTTISQDYKRCFNVIFKFITKKLKSENLLNEVKLNFNNESSKKFTS